MQRLNLPGELAKHAVSEGTKAVTKFVSSKGNDGPMPPPAKSASPMKPGSKPPKPVRRSNSKSARAGLTFPVGRVRTLIAERYAVPVTQLIVHFFEGASTVLAVALLFTSLLCLSTWWPRFWSSLATPRVITRRHAYITKYSRVLTSCRSASSLAMLCLRSVMTRS